MHSRSSTGAVRWLTPTAYSRISSRLKIGAPGREVPEVLRLDLLEGQKVADTDMDGQREASVREQFRQHVEREEQALQERRPRLGVRAERRQEGELSADRRHEDAHSAFVHRQLDGE